MACVASDVQLFHHLCSHRRPDLEAESTRCPRSEQRGILYDLIAKKLYKHLYLTCIAPIDAVVEYRPKLFADNVFQITPYQEPYDNETDKLWNDLYNGNVFPTSL